MEEYPNQMNFDEKMMDKDDISVMFEYILSFCTILLLLTCFIFCGFVIGGAIGYLVGKGNKSFGLKKEEGMK